MNYSHHLILFCYPQKYRRCVLLLYLLVRQSANACVVPPLPRRVRQESAHITTKTVKAGKYAKITDRGSGQYQRFVSAFSVIKLPILYALLRFRSLKI